MVDREAVRDMALHLTLLDWQFLSNISRVRVLHCLPCYCSGRDRTHSRTTSCCDAALGPSVARKEFVAQHTSYATECCEPLLTSHTVAARIVHRASLGAQNTLDFVCAKCHSWDWRLVLRCVMIFSPVVCAAHSSTVRPVSTCCAPFSLSPPATVFLRVNTCTMSLDNTSSARSPPTWSCSYGD